MADQQEVTPEQQAFVDVVRATSLAAVETAFGEALDASELNESAKYPAYRAFAHALVSDGRGLIAAWEAIGQEAQAIMKSAMANLIDSRKVALQGEIDKLEALKQAPPPPEP